VPQMMRMPLTSCKAITFLLFFFSLSRLPRFALLTLFDIGLEVAAFALFMAILLVEITRPRHLIVRSLQETGVHSSVPTNILKLYSSVQKPMNIRLYSSVWAGN
jgi:hypothetical protein